MSQGLQAVIAAVAITFFVGIFMGVQILFRRFIIRDHVKEPDMSKSREKGDRRHYKKVKIRKKKAG